MESLAGRAPGRSQRWAGPVLSELLRGGQHQGRVHETEARFLETTLQEYTAGTPGGDPPFYLSSNRGVQHQLQSKVSSLARSLSHRVDLF